MVSLGVHVLLSLAELLMLCLAQFLMLCLAQFLMLCLAHVFCSVQQLMLLFSLVTQYKQLRNLLFSSTAKLVRAYHILEPVNVDTQGHSCNSSTIHVQVYVSQEPVSIRPNLLRYAFIEASVRYAITKRVGYVCMCVWARVHVRTCVRTCCYARGEKHCK